MNDIIVVDVETGEELPGIPTPRLMQLGRAEAYRVDAPSIESGAVWYAHEPGYESPTNEYRRVRIVEKERA